MLNIYITEELARIHRRELLEAIQLAWDGDDARIQRLIRRRVTGDRSRIVARLLLLLVLMATCMASPARAHQVDQALLAGGSRNDSGNGIAVDSAGNRYLTGTFQDTATFGAGTGAVRVRSRGGDDAFVARYDAAGDLAWVQPIAGSVSDIGRGVALGANGTLYVTGQFGTLATFGNGVALSSAGQGDAFLAQYTREGAVRWAVRIGGSLGDAGFAVAALGPDVIVAGLFSGTATVTHADGTIAARLTSVGGSDVLVARYSLGGRLVWAQRAGGSGNDAARAVAVDSAGEVYVTGSFSATATFGDGESARQLSSAGLDDLFVARYDSNGALRWAIASGGARSDRGLGIALDAAGTSVVTGFFTDQARFGEQVLSGTGPEILLARLDSDGRYLQGEWSGAA